LEQENGPAAEPIIVAAPPLAAPPREPEIIATFPRLTERPHTDVGLMRHVIREAGAAERASAVMSMTQTAAADGSLAPPTRAALAELIGLAAAQTSPTAGEAFLLAVEVLLEQAVVAAVVGTHGGAAGDWVGERLRAERGLPRRIALADTLATHGEALTAMARRTPHVFAGPTTTATAWGLGRRPPGGPTVARYRAPHNPFTRLAAPPRRFPLPPPGPPPFRG